MSEFGTLLECVKGAARLRESPDTVHTPDGYVGYNNKGFDVRAFMIVNDGIWDSPNIHWTIYDDVMHVYKTTDDVSGIRLSQLGLTREVRKPTRWEDISETMASHESFHEQDRVGSCSGRVWRKDGKTFVSFWQPRRGQSIPSCREMIEEYLDFVGGDVMAEVWRTDDRYEFGLAHPTCIPISQYWAGRIDTGSADAENRTLRAE